MWLCEGAGWGALHNDLCKMGTFAKPLLHFRSMFSVPCTVEPNYAVSTTPTTLTT